MPSNESHQRRSLKDPKNMTPSQQKINTDTGRSPGKIFKFDKNTNVASSMQQVGNSRPNTIKEDGYSTLLKYGQAL